MRALNASRHLHGTVPPPGGGLENPIFIDPPGQRGVESWDVCEPDDTLGYPQRIERPERGLGAVTLDYLRQRELSAVLAIEPGSTLPPGEAPEPRSKQEDPSQSFQHSVIRCSG